jgi:hypothetical protein
VVAAVMLGYALHGPAERVLAPKSQSPSLPTPWKIRVVVQNGSGDINYTRRVASRIAALGYQIAMIERASHFNYKHTTVFYANVKNGKALGERLAGQLGVEVLPLPLGKNPLRLIVIVGPANLALH